MAVGEWLTPKWLILLILAGCSPIERESPRQTNKTDPLYQGLNGVAVQSARNTLQAALESLRSSATLKWQDASGSGSGSITPIRTFRIATGHYCREYRETVSTSAGESSATRVACRDTDGIWKVARR